MHINLCGVNLAHDKSFCIDRPFGSGDNLFIYTRTPFYLMHEGKLTRFPADTTVFFRKGMPQNFRALGQIYADDYIHFDASDEEMEFIDSLGIPSGVPFTNLDTSVFLGIHRYIFIEHQSHSPHKSESINYLLRYFLIKLSEAIKEERSISVSRTTKAALHDLRSEIYEHVSEQYTVSALARRVGLSDSYFQAVYKKMFGISPINDIIFARIDRAKILILSTDHPISTVSAMCGYENESHFSRQFKKLTGVTPSEYKASDKEAKK